MTIKEKLILVCVNNGMTESIAHDVVEKYTDKVNANAIINLLDFNADSTSIHDMLYTGMYDACKKIEQEINDLQELCE